MVAPCVGLDGIRRECRYDESVFGPRKQLEWSTARRRHDEAVRARHVSRFRRLAMLAIVLASIPALSGASLAQTLMGERSSAAARAEFADRRYQRELPGPPKAENGVRREPSFVAY